MAHVEELLYSPFLDPGLHSRENSLAVLHLTRENQIHTVLCEEDEKNEGYEEGKVTNTRFGSFPHSTLIGTPWGSQVRASAVDTGSRGRRTPHENANKSNKRKRGSETPGDATPLSGKPEELPLPKAATSGFAHLLPPTPESWTASLPHRTQVVYTPDYSYILHRLRVRPGSVLIEAGAGSGSFTHAAARAVFSGRARLIDQEKQEEKGKVWSYEFHEQRVGVLRTEIQNHGLNGVVEITHRDVCQDGFLPSRELDQGVNADAIFLDLPAPWVALENLTRRVASPLISIKGSVPDAVTTAESSSPYLLNPRHPVHICTFSPCIEQVQRTIAVLRQKGWLEIECVELAARRLEVKRERVSLHDDGQGQRGIIGTPTTVEEAVSRLRDQENRVRAFHEESSLLTSEDAEIDAEGAATPSNSGSVHSHTLKQQKQLGDRSTPKESRKLYAEGVVTHRSEAELKTHTSYLVFAVLPPEWSEEDEEQMRAKWPAKVDIEKISKKDRGGLSKRQMKRAAKEAEGDNPKVEVKERHAEAAGDDGPVDS